MNLTCKFSQPAGGKVTKQVEVVTLTLFIYLKIVKGLLNKSLFSRIVCSTSIKVILLFVHPKVFVKTKTWLLKKESL